MKNIKDITISIFAVIGFVAIITAFNNQPEQANQTIYGTPESHVWDMQLDDTRVYMINKATGEVRFASTTASIKNGGDIYNVLKPAQ